MRLGEHLRARPRMIVAIAVGAASGWALPDTDAAITRILVGWNVGVWLLLGLMGWMMLRADQEKMRRDSVAQAEGAPVVLALVVVAAASSLAAIILELSASKSGGGGHHLSRIVLALVTIAGSWLLLPTLFGMTYASRYYVDALSAADGDARSGDDLDVSAGGLQFPSNEPAFRPDYADFLYFSFTIAVASQTADVAISTREMRRLVLLQSVLSFAFNTTILALAINIAASMF